MNEIIQLHIKNKYYIDVHKQDNGCIVKTPANIFTEPQFNAETTVYKIENNILSVNNYDYVVPNYCIRTLILVDILLKLTKLEIPLKLLLFFDGLQQKNSLLELISVPGDAEDKRKDILMFHNLSAIMLSEFDIDDARKLDIEQGYSLILQICEKGGI